MYAIVQVGGRQYRAAAGSRVLVDRLQVEAGAPIVLDDVRMLVAEDGDASATEVGTPKVDGARVSATAVSHLRGPKVVVFKYKPKKRYRRTRGFRAELTELRIERVLRKGEVEEPVETPSAAVVPAPKTPRRRTPAAAKVAGEAPV
ncbi:MAG: 50S ribosomal protein L21, partial [Candidatus Dormiibacterota bacterium]